MKGNGGSKELTLEVPATPRLHFISVVLAGSEKQEGISKIKCGINLQDRL